MNDSRKFVMPGILHCVGRIERLKLFMFISHFACIVTAAGYSSKYLIFAFRIYFVQVQQSKCPYRSFQAFITCESSNEHPLKSNLPCSFHILHCILSYNGIQIYDTDVNICTHSTPEITSHSQNFSMPPYLIVHKQFKT